MKLLREYLLFITSNYMNIYRMDIKMTEARRGYYDITSNSNDEILKLHKFMFVFEKDYENHWKDYLPKTKVLYYFSGNILYIHKSAYYAFYFCMERHPIAEDIKSN